MRKISLMFLSSFLAVIMLGFIGAVGADTCTDSGDNFYIRDVVTINKSDGTSFIREDTCLEDGRVQEITCCSGCDNDLNCWNTCAKYMQCPNGCQSGKCYYPGFNMKTDKKEYGSGDTILLKLSTSGKIKIDLYVHPSKGYGSEDGVLVESGLVVDGQTTYKIAIKGSPKIFDETDEYLIVVSDSGTNRIGGVNTNSIPVKVSFTQTSPAQTCTDSDGGKEYYHKGIAKGIYGTCKDSCISQQNGEVWIQECYCDEDNPWSASITTECPPGSKCNDGQCEGSVLDMDKCLDSPNNYWDQEANKCFSGYSEHVAKQLCTDPDGGKNIFQQAHTYGFRSYSSASDPSRDLRIRTGGKDGCVNDKQLIENYCDGNGFIQTEYIDCPNGCDMVNGACVKGEPVTEKITCKFEDTLNEQKCYLAGQFTDADLGTKYCIAAAGPGSCVIAYSSYKGEQVTWKSSCGQYQYTTQDGNDEVIYFKCSEGETNITEIKNNGFRKIYFQCYDGAESKSTEREACKSADYWKKFAENFCQSHCNKKTGKCGVNTFSIGDECYLGEGLCREGETANNCCERWANENNIIKPACVGGWTIENDQCSWSCKECTEDSDCPQPKCKESAKCLGVETKCIEGKCISEEEIIAPILVCKDSCPLDGKCYPFGYRKSGKFCSDTGGFTEQFAGDKTCDNNFECSSNVCVSGKCVSEGFIEKIMSWFKRLFGG